MEEQIAEGDNHAGLRHVAMRLGGRLTQPAQHIAKARLDLRDENMRGGDRLVV
jgi:hypothetical protein